MYFTVFKYDDDDDDDDDDDVSDHLNGCYKTTDISYTSVDAEWRPCLYRFGLFHKA